MIEKISLICGLLLSISLVVIGFCVFFSEGDILWRIISGCASILIGISLSCMVFSLLREGK